jgi:hypothetical protein
VNLQTGAKQSKEEKDLNEVKQRSLAREMVNASLGVGGGVGIYI